ncbi:DUF6527 family protein [Tepidicaulis sp. LMO-SS28]|uniref:DUF6527 family protein n=1 Tax=Tepidicaulis sp. LMO-SS28 TaxID=3447455 RepID=UPI003EDFA18D
MRCPCGCGDTIVLQLIPEARPRWDLFQNDQGHPTLRPSVDRNAGCESHFWVRNGKITWCR